MSKKDVIKTFILAPQWTSFQCLRKHSLDVTLPSGEHRCTCCAQTLQIKRSTGSCMQRTRIMVRVQAVLIDKNKAQIYYSERTSGTGYC